MQWPRRAGGGHRQSFAAGGRRPPGSRSRPGAQNAAGPPGPVGPGAGLALRRPDHRAAAGLQHLPAAVDDLAVVHQLPRQPARTPKSLWVGIDNYRRVLGDEAIWENMRATAHFLVLVDRAATAARLRAGAAAQPALSLAQLLEHRDPAADDAGAGRGGHLLEVLLRAAVRHLQRHRRASSAASGNFTMLGTPQLSPWAIVLVDTWMWTPYVMLLLLAGLRRSRPTCTRPPRSTAPRSGPSSGASRCRW